MQDLYNVIFYEVFSEMSDKELIDFFLVDQISKQFRISNS